LTDFSENDLLIGNQLLRDRWEMIQRPVQDFWKQWMTPISKTLSNGEQENLKINDLTTVEGRFSIFKMKNWTHD